MPRPLGGKRRHGSGPVVITPHSKPGAVRQAILSSPPEPPEPKILSGKPEVVLINTALLAPPRPQISLPPVPVDPRFRLQPRQQRPRQTRRSSRLVNTKRITLNFEVKDVGPSGLSSVEIVVHEGLPRMEEARHTCDQGPRAYVIEVDDEGHVRLHLARRASASVWARSLPPPAISLRCG